jgi:hypothetical protein
MNCFWLKRKEGRRERKGKGSEEREGRRDGGKEGWFLIR